MSICLGLLYSTLAFGHGDDDPVLTKVMINQLEYRDGRHGELTVWDMNAWLGQDKAKVWLKSEGEIENEGGIDSGDVHSSEIQLLYGQAIAPYWDVQVGVKKDLDPSPSREWAVLALHGLAPYFFETEASLFWGPSGRSALRLDMEKEFPITQRWILSPEIEVNLYGENDPEIGQGSGLSDIELGLRLRYEVVREFAPYMGINWEKSYGKTADYREQAGEPESDTLFVVGVRLWF